MVLVKASPSSEINESSEKERAGGREKGKGKNESEKTFSSIYMIGQQHDSRY